MNATCFFCGCTMPLGEAIEEGWIPTCFDGDVERSGPVCCRCQAEGAVHVAADDEWEF